MQNTIQNTSERATALGLCNNSWLLFNIIVFKQCTSPCFRHWHFYAWDFILFTLCFTEVASLFVWSSPLWHADIKAFCKTRQRCPSAQGLIIPPTDPLASRSVLLHLHNSYWGNMWAGFIKEPSAALWLWDKIKVK